MMWLAMRKDKVKVMIFYGIVKIKAFISLLALITIENKVLSISKARECSEGWVSQFYYFLFEDRFD